ncbi:MAG: 2-oxoacid:acceptor oxidoreductase family protein [Polyangiaceae bacterium]|nr:2-oxoacid:acceptor oxidoreductase family protein [Polyangiaceae bacterium]
MSEPSVQLVVVGVGGQGVLAAAQILGLAAHAEQKPAVIGQLHGMSQRGGSVQCTVVVGEAESSFLTTDEADAVVAFEPLEALRAAAWIGARTRVVSSRTLLPPVDVTLGRATVPGVDEIATELAGRAAEVILLDTADLLRGTSAERTLNVVMLGAAFGLGMLPFTEGTLLEAIGARCGARYEAANQRAFCAGRDAARDARSKA